MERFYGYHRTSTKEQHLDRGIKGIEDFCKERGYKLEKIFTDQSSGKNMERPRYTVLKEDILRRGDTLVLYELDRLARRKRAIAEELAYFDKAGIRVMILNIPTTLMEMPCTGDSVYSLMMETVNKIIIEIYSMQAQAEVEQKEKRQREGIDAMKVRGDWDKYGRPRKMEQDAFKKEYCRVERGEIGSLALMRELGLQRDTYFRYVREYKHSHGESKEDARKE